MVHVVVLVHSIATNEEDIFHGFREIDDFGESVVRSEIGGIRFLHPDDDFVEYVARINNLDFRKLTDRERREIGIRAVPELITLIAEIFEADPYRVRILDEIGAPVVEYLQPSDLYVPFLDVYSVVSQSSLTGIVEKKKSPSIVSFVPVSTSSTTIE
jgi:hypothetical protein